MLFNQDVFGVIVMKRGYMIKIYLTVRVISDGVMYNWKFSIFSIGTKYQAIYVYVTEDNLLLAD